MEIFAMRRYKLYLEKIHPFYIHLFLAGLPYARHCSRHESYTSEQCCCLMELAPQGGRQEKIYMRSASKLNKL